MKDLRQAIKGLGASFRNRDLRKSDRILIAKIADVTPFATDGFVVCQLEDGTYINAHSWLGVTLEVGQTVAIIRVSDHNWNSFFLLSVNASLDTSITPFLPPSAGSTNVHALDSDRHTGNLPWLRVDTSSDKVNLTSQVTGQLPLANQVLQLAEETTEVVNQSITGFDTVSGSIAACKRGMGTLVSVSGGSSFTLTFWRDAAHVTAEYQTVVNTASPFVDYMFWYHHADDSMIYWTITNVGSTATFVVSTTMLVIEP